MRRRDYILNSREFEDKYTDYYKGKSIKEDVTQSFWYSMYLGKRRLDRLGLSMEFLSGIIMMMNLRRHKQAICI